jgi:hypothetical protein
MTTQLALIETATLPALSFKDITAKITSITVERVYNTDERTGQRYVSYHKFIKAVGIDVRDDAEVDINMTFDLRGQRVSAVNNVRITPKAWKDDMLEIFKSHGVNAKRLGLFDAKYIITDPE